MNVAAKANQRISLDQLRFDSLGLLPAVVQDFDSRQVLMLAYMNFEALERTMDSGLVWFYSRSRKMLWQKGATSGNLLHLVRLTADCDGDTLLVEVNPAGPACHTGATSCFHNPLVGSPSDEPAAVAAELVKVIRQRQLERPEGSYVTKLFEGGVDRIAKKVGEEATEVVIAAKNRDHAELRHEMADLWFHCYVLLAEAGVSPDAVWETLKRRRR